MSRCNIIGAKVSHILFTPAPTRRLTFSFSASLIAATHRCFVMCCTARRRRPTNASAWKSNGTLSQTLSSLNVIWSWKQLLAHLMNRRRSSSSSGCRNHQQTPCAAERICNSQTSMNYIVCNPFNNSKIFWTDLARRVDPRWPINSFFKKIDLLNWKWM